ncbi:PQQ-binding-like beta-propeller repeat protein, partial [Streptomyces sp. NPDC014744]|uniref:outer membrane protein assembly factor BamB family protein n=1 Tax=Streptomyces sp. NPDC014744 TaxID=3364903 RepID=UPI0036FEA44E
SNTGPTPSTASSPGPASPSTPQHHPNEPKSVPTVADKVVYVGCNNNTVYALDTATGNKRWAYATDGKVQSSPTVVDGVVYIGSDDHHLYALDAATGNKI